MAVDIVNRDLEVTRSFAAGMIVRLRSSASHIQVTHIGYDWGRIRFLNQRAAKLLNMTGVS